MNQSDLHHELHVAIASLDLVKLYSTAGIDCCSDLIKMKRNSLVSSHIG